MAIRFSPSSLPIFPSLKVSTTNSTRVVMMCVNNHISINLQIRTYCDHKIKVFEDVSAGIVCYKDENGEITCEGYDEGPRLYQPYTTCTNSANSGRGDEEIIELLQRCLLQNQDDHFNAADVEIAGFDSSASNQF